MGECVIEKILKQVEYESACRKSMIRKIKKREVQENSRELKETQENSRELKRTQENSRELKGTQGNSCELI